MDLTHIGTTQHVADMVVTAIMIAVDRIPMATDITGIMTFPRSTEVEPRGTATLLGNTTKVTVAMIEDTATTVRATMIDSDRMEGTLAGGTKVATVKGEIENAMIVAMEEIEAVATDVTTVATAGNETMEATIVLEKKIVVMMEAIATATDAEKGAGEAVVEAVALKKALVQALSLALDTS
ncbi:hypothetical protein PPTG_19708 [Phytophthora nicotianae INRA-310]|uniref:Uncharacterized protein n=1 Tax=Phytophthora nicotianae (strain INRA-310) TaxID=761204 RepID=W2PBH0_PHYN3|nr:hypothetical protein PPTG_19708 [Phytophthora nicotianae INRA-310]ETM98181.1 hypothetical protein PPTG_19708 [Phytophthora nicotianae INRA-310]